MDLFSPTTVVIAGGGGAMKSGIPNACEVLTFDANTSTLSQTASQYLEQAPVALATATDGVVHTVIGTGCKNFVYADSKLSAASEFQQDLRICSSQEQSAVVVSQNGQTIVVASDEGHVCAMALPHYELLYRGKLHTQGITDMSIMHDGKLVASAGRDRKAYIWQANTGHILYTVEPSMPAVFKTHVRAIRFCRAQPDIIYTAESNPRRGGWMCVRRRESSTEGPWETIASIKTCNDALTAFCVNETGDYAAVSSSEGHVAMFRWNGSVLFKVWSSEKGTQWLKPSAPPHVLPITAMHFCGDDHLLTASADYTVGVWPTKATTNWARLFRISFWFSAIIVAFLAVLLAEDHHLHPTILDQRQRLQPILDPHLSNAQSYVRPVIRRRHKKLTPYIERLTEAARPHAQYVRENAATYIERGRQYRETWQPRIESKFFQVRSALVTKMSSSGRSKPSAISPENRPEKTK